MLFVCFSGGTGNFLFSVTETFLFTKRSLSMKRKELAGTVENIQHFVLEGRGGGGAGGGAVAERAATLPAYKQTEANASRCARRGSRRASFSCLSL